MNPHRNFYPFPPVLCKIQGEAVSKLPHLELRDPLREQVVLSILQFVTERMIERSLA